MQNLKISTFQFFVLIYLFEIGTAVLVGLGMQAKQDAWLAVLIGMFCGLGLFFMYNYVFHQCSNQLFTSCILRICGKYVGIPIAVCYILWFLYDASRDLRDVGELINLTLPETPLLAVNFIMISLCCYAVKKGIEAFARSAEILVVVMFTYLILGTVFLFASGVVKGENLLPILENGWKPVLKTAFPLTMTFPFGEAIVFTMFMPFLNEPKKSTKIGLFAIAISGVVLAFSAFLNISVLGTEIASTATFPLMKTAQKINVGHFIQRLDAIVLSTLIIGGFFKISILFFAAIIGIQDLVKVKKRGYLILGIGIVILFASIKIAENFSEHLKIGLKIVPYYLHLPIQVLIPLVLVSIILIRKKWGSFNSD